MEFGQFEIVHTKTLQKQIKELIIGKYSFVFFIEKCLIYFIYAFVKKTQKIKIYFFNEVFSKTSKSTEFRNLYDEEIVRLKLAKQIKEIRLRTNLTQKDVARRTNMTQSVIARIESGNHGYSLGTLYRIAHAFGKEVQLT